MTDFAFKVRTQNWDERYAKWPIQEQVACHFLWYALIIHQYDFLVLTNPENVDPLWPLLNLWLFVFQYYPLASNK